MIIKNPDTIVPGFLYCYTIPMHILRLSLVLLLFIAPSAEAHESTYHTGSDDALLHVESRVLFTITRLANIANRIDSRATTLIQSGKDTTAVRIPLEEARVRLVEAHTLITDHEGATAEAKARIREAGALLFEAHTYTQDALTRLEEADMQDPQVIHTSATELEVQ